MNQPTPKQRAYLDFIRDYIALHRVAPAEHEMQTMRGTLKRLSTNQGGDSLTLVITVGALEFSTEGLFSPVKKGTPVYDAAADLAVGQCVVFSAKELKSSSVVEKSKVCDTQYFANFTALKACP